MKTVEELRKRSVESCNPDSFRNDLDMIADELERTPWWDEYQKWVNSKVKKDFGSFPEALGCQLLGLAGEAGELCDLVKKKYFHGKEVSRERIVKEFGDALFYLSSAADLMGISLTEIVQANIIKLNARYPKGFDPARAHGPGEVPIEEQTSVHFREVPVEPEDLDMNFPTTH